MALLPMVGFWVFGFKGLGFRVSGVGFRVLGFFVSGLGVILGSGFWGFSGLQNVRVLHGALACVLLQGFANCVGNPKP